MFRALFQLIIVLAIFLGIGEGILWLRDDGAFPHLNVYAEDAETGVRLRPGASQRFRFGANPTTQVRINTQGYRGGEWPADTHDAIVVLGDSQTFGLGVEENETFSARLAELTHRPVLNAGVPTFGPPEMLRTARELMATCKPRTMIFTINMLNDLFEVRRPNRERHSVWDGWVVRAETAPLAIKPFPYRDKYRDYVATKSHLLYGVRRYMYDAKPAKIGALPSEGSWKDVLALDAESGDRQEAPHGGEDLHGIPADIVAAAALADPARPTELSAFQLQRAVAQRRALAQKKDDAALPEAVRHAVEYRAALATRGPARQTALIKLREARREPLTPVRPASALDGTLRDLVELCHPPSCEPMLVVLPIDLAVSPDEWRKYGLEPHDVADIQSLTDQVMQSAVGYGIRAVDTTASLRASEPDAFLKGDAHLAPKAHTAVAGEIAVALAKAPPLARANGTLPEGRSRVPSPEELDGVAATAMRGAEKIGCTANQVDEWLRVVCRSGRHDVPRRVEMVAGTRDSFTNVTSDAMTLVAPVLSDTPLTVDLVWADRTQRLHAKRDADGGIAIALDAPKKKPAPPLPVRREQEALCACSRLLTSSKDCTVYGSAQPECFATYAMQQPDADGCRRLLDCAQGFPTSPPSCPEGSTVAGGTSQCFRECSDTVACDHGKCAPWPQTHVCMGLP